LLTQSPCFQPVLVDVDPAPAFEGLRLQRRRLFFSLCLITGWLIVHGGTALDRLAVAQEDAMERDCRFTATAAATALPISTNHLNERRC
jgi:hypothetical protein